MRNSNIPDCRNVLQDVENWIGTYFYQLQHWSIYFTKTTQKTLISVSG